MENTGSVENVVIRYIVKGGKRALKLAKRLRKELKRLRKMVGK